MLLSEALRFWIVDLWGDGWDRHRRRLLFRHFWAYLRHPHIPAEYLPAGLVTEESRQRATAQTAFSVAYLKRIQAVQAGPGSTRRVYLTYRPLGKNSAPLGHRDPRERRSWTPRPRRGERASVGAKGVEGDRARLGPLGLGLLS